MTSRLLAVTVALFLAVPVWAHHPFSAEYDWKKPITVAGTVTKVDWGNPHARVFVDARDATGKTVNWEFELGTISGLTKAGWKKTTVKTGDSITVDGWQSKSRANGANAKSVRLPNGNELSAASSIVDPNANDAPKMSSAKK
jgi:hypothetical protein